MATTSIGTATTEVELQFQYKVGEQVEAACPNGQSYKLPPN